MEITDEKLLKIALVTSLIGIIGLIIFTPTIEVKIDGVIHDISQSKSKSSYFLTINDGTGQMQLIIFKTQAAELQENHLDITDFKNRKVEVVGKITEYKSQLELILSSKDSLKIIS